MNQNIQVINFDELKKLLQDWSIKMNGKNNIIEQLSWHLIETARNKNTPFKKDNMTLLVIDISESVFAK